VWRFFFKPIADHAPWRLALYELILQAVREELNEKCADQPDLRVGVTDSVQGLSAVTDVALMTLTTSAREGLREKIERMASGCIGVTGLRGVGKSTLIRDFCSHRYGTPMWDRECQTKLAGLRIQVQAPCRYGAREFLIHLYTCLCQAVLADVRLNPTSFLHRIVLSLFLPRTVRPVMLLRILAAIAFFAVAGDLAFRATAGHWWLPAWTSPGWEWIGVAVALVVALFVAGWRTRQALLEVRGVLTLATDAQARLEKLHFQRTVTHGYGGTLGGPMGIAANVSGSHSLTEQMLSMPELVDDYCDFVERVVAALKQVVSTEEGPHVEVRLVVGIDELDQIGDVRAADLFLGELQSIVGTSNCVYIISVAPKALIADDELEVPNRNSASAIFDELVWVEPLDLPEARALLNQRTIGLQDGFIELCYVLSGGLPQELLRIARIISAVKDGKSGATPELSGAVAVAITNELDGLAHLAMADAASLGILAAPGLLKLLSDNLRQISQSRKTSRTTQPVSIRKFMVELSGLWGGERRQQFTDAAGAISPQTAEICDGLLAGLYFLLTVEQYFAERPNQVAPKLQDGTCTLDDEGTLRGLAWARVALDVNPYMAASVIGDTRKGGKSAIEPVFLRSPTIEHGKTDRIGRHLRRRVAVSQGSGH
jgi:hypothetical protein